MTPRCFAAWGKGKGKANQHRAEEQMAHAYMTGYFERVEKLKPLAHYLGQLKPKSKQTPDQMLAAFMALQDRGAPMTIRKLN